MPLNMEPGNVLKRWRQKFWNVDINLKQSTDKRQI